MKKLTILLMLLMPLLSLAQDSTRKIRVLPPPPPPPPDIIEAEVFTVVEIMPQFPGGQRAMEEFIRYNFTMPPEALEIGAEGKIYYEFVIDTFGKMQNIKILKDGVGWGCGEEGLKVLNLMNEKFTWKPGTQRNRKVQVRYRYPMVIRTYSPEDDVRRRDPKYPGGPEELNRNFFKEYRNPPDVLRVGAYGIINFEIVIGVDGTFKHSILLYDGVGFGAGEEAQKVIDRLASAAPWKPGTVNGQPTEMSYFYQINLMMNNTQPYIPEPTVKAESLLGDSVLKMKILRKILKRYELADDTTNAEQFMYVDLLITENGEIEYVSVARNDFDKKLAKRVIGSLVPEKSRWRAARYQGTAVRSRYRLVISRGEIEYYLKTQPN